MPKMKTKSGAAKRFKPRGNGTFKRACAYKNHILTKMSTKRKRGLRDRTEVLPMDAKSVKKMLRLI